VQELTAVEERFNRALLRSDWRTIEQMQADELVFTNTDRSVSDKATELGSLRSGDVKFDSIEMSDVKVDQFVDVSVVTGKLIEKGRSKIDDLSGTYRFTDVWVKRRGGWQLVAGQETLVSAVTSGQQTPVAVDEEPHHHVLFTNEFVIVIRATLGAGETTLYHVHSHDTADVNLVSSTTSEELFGKQEGLPETSHAGDVSADSIKESITHRVRNVGSGPMDTFHVEFLQRPAQPSSQAAARVAAEIAEHMLSQRLRPNLHRLPQQCPETIR